MSVDNQSAPIEAAWVPRNRRLFVFAVTEQAKISGSRLYQPKRNRGFLSQAQEIHVLAAARDCRIPWASGQKAFISDGFELEPVELGAWESNRERPEFRELATHVSEVEGKVSTMIVHEDSILAIED